MQQKNIIIFSVILFIVCSVWLFSVSSGYLNPDKNKNWWSLYFSDPQSSDDISFVIENHSDKTQFQWKILNGQENIKNRQATIEKGEAYKVIFSAPKNNSGKKIAIEIDDGESKKIIYKNL